MGPQQDLLHYYICVMWFSLRFAQWDLFFLVFQKRPLRIQAWGFFPLGFNDQNQVKDLERKPNAKKKWWSADVLLYFKVVVLCVFCCLLLILTRQNTTLMPNSVSCSCVQCEFNVQTENNVKSCKLWLESCANYSYSLHLTTITTTSVPLPLLPPQLLL